MYCQFIVEVMDEYIYNYCHIDFWSILPSSSYLSYYTETVAQIGAAALNQDIVSIMMASHC